MTFLIHPLCIGESPSISYLPKGPSLIIFQEWTDTKTFSDLKYTSVYNYVSWSACIALHD